MRSVQNMALDVGNNRRIFCPKVEPFFEVFPWCYKLLEIVFIMDFSGHFDIWNNLEKNFFFHFSKIHRGDPYDYDQNRKGPPYGF